MQKIVLALCLFSVLACISATKSFDVDSNVNLNSEEAESAFMRRSEKQLEEAEEMGDDLPEENKDDGSGVFSTTGTYDDDEEYMQGATGDLSYELTGAISGDDFAITDSADSSSTGISYPAPLELKPVPSPDFSTTDNSASSPDNNDEKTSSDSDSQQLSGSGNYGGGQGTANKQPGGAYDIEPKHAATYSGLFTFTVVACLAMSVLGSVMWLRRRRNINRNYTALHDQV